MTTLADLDTAKLDTLLAWNVRSRAQLQEQALRALCAIDERTARIEQLLDQRTRLQHG